MPVTEVNQSLPNQTVHFWLWPRVILFLNGISNRSTWFTNVICCHQQQRNHQQRNHQQLFHQQHQSQNQKAFWSELVIWILLVSHVTTDCGLSPLIQKNWTSKISKSRKFTWWHISIIWPLKISKPLKAQRFFISDIQCRITTHLVSSTDLKTTH